MRFRHCLLLPFLLLLSAAPVQAQRKQKAKPRVKSAQTVIKELRAEVKKLTAERDDAKAKQGEAEKAAGEAKAAAATGVGMAEDLASLQASRDLARQDAERFRKELESLKAGLKENQQGAESLLAQVREADTARDAALKEAEGLRGELQQVKEKLQGSGMEEGALVPLTPEVVPARPVNLSRVRPDTPRGVDRGVVVVNVLVSEKGDVLDVKLLQGLPQAEDDAVKQAHQRCLDAAKRLVFDPARSLDGKLRLKVWQGVGFYLD